MVYVLYGKDFPNSTFDMTIVLIGQNFTLIKGS